MMSTFLPLLALACTPGASFPPDDSAAPNVTTDEDQTSANTLAPAAAAPVAFTVALDPELDGFVEVRAYREEGGALAWAGAPIVSRAVTGRAMSLELPVAPPAVDRAACGDGPISYAIALRAPDADEEPGVYLGLADAELVYGPAGAAANARDTWNVVVTDAEGGAAWSDLGTLVEIAANVAGPGRLDLAGDALIDAPPGTHLSIATGEDADAVSAYDAPIGPEWSLSLGLAPRLEALASHDGLEGALLQAYVYADADGDNVRVDEPLLGRACLGQTAPVLAWFPYAHDLAAARALRAHGVRGGWDLLDASPTVGGAPVPLDLHTALTLAETCE